MNKPTLSPRPVSHGLRRLVKDGHMSPREALRVLANARRAGHFVKIEIEAWLQRKLLS